MDSFTNLATSFHKKIITMNYMTFVAALIPLVIGAIWYNPKVMGTVWMNASGVTQERIEATSKKMPLIFLASYVLSLAMAVVLTTIVIHQFSTLGLFAMDIKESAEFQAYMKDFLAKYGDRHRSFGHGAAHGGMVALFLAWPIIAIISMFERRGWKYTAIHTAYWFICLILMGGMLCHFGTVSV